ncbi:dihydroorotase [Varunaivibrio sulfuroxidans]|uniref:Dihydroorotase n=1 Tax=Varunaivibrio sulfuroxidans TaxID=1773489 RepID=A0A4V2UNL5_9PROT|nr:dihydroorotase [Varunaivibrio sulfuroxidans]TCS62501.1 dihydroorotase [Varunaivibrio sulfuroxidans]WES30828.1 dihydroorotase [Varunaivibrio sulfuroxidans]
MNSRSITLDALTERSETPTPTGRPLAFVNARILDPASGADIPADPKGGVLCRGETIIAAGGDIFAASIPDDAQVIDCAGHCLAPGLVDMRIQIRGAGFLSTGNAAVAGGVTSAACLPNTDPVIDDMSVVEFIARRARKVGLVKVYTYGAATKGLEGREIAEMGMLAEAGAVAFSDAVKVIADAQVMRQALSYAATFGLLVVQHPEEESLAGDGVMNEGETASRLGLSGIPREAEAIIVERDIRLAELTGGRVHFAHISTAAALDAIRRAKARGLAVTCDTAPPYFALNETAVGDYRTFAKVSPPLRAEDDRAAVIAAIADGTIDAIASDHSPHSEDAKRLPFAQAAFGGVGLETLLAVSLELYHNGHLDLLSCIEKLSLSPARLLGLNAGALTAGAPADLIVFDPEQGWKVDADTLNSKSKNSPFDGRPVQGRVLTTVVDGRIVFRA